MSFEVDNNRKFDIDHIILFATAAHTGQTRKRNGLPFIVHPINVLHIVGTEFKITDYDTWKASICHDLLEDTDLTRGALENEIHKNAADIVQELTFVYDKESSTTKKQQKSKYLESFKNKSVQALVIKIADRLANVRDFMYTDIEYAKKYFNKASTLMDLVYSRGCDIVDFYGEDTLKRIRYAVFKIEGLL